MPAEPQTVALYLGYLAADSKAIATIEQARAAISHALVRVRETARLPRRG